MKTIKKLLGIIVVLLTATVVLQADKISVLDFTNPFSDDPLAGAVFKIGLVNGVLRSIPSDTQLPADVLSLLKDEAHKAGTLFNFVCAQVYANHLKDLRGPNGLDSENHYTKNNPTVMPRRLSIAMTKGSQHGAELMANASPDTQLLCIHTCCWQMQQVNTFLCSEFESSYRKLFDLKDADTEDIQNPYHSFFCKASKEKLETKEEL